MKTGFEYLGIDELRRQSDMAYAHNDNQMLKLLDLELSKRDVETYEAEQAEARFGA